MISIFVHIVTFNSARWIEKCLDSLLKQEGFENGKNLWIEVTDNASQDGTQVLLQERFSSTISIVQNINNIGFAAGHNQGVKSFLKTDCNLFLVLNPDVSLESRALLELSKSLLSRSDVGSATPLLYRGDEALQAMTPKVIDAAGMYITPSLRHFDRGSGQTNIGPYTKEAFVFGGTGACLLMKREFISDVILDTSVSDEKLQDVLGHLTLGKESRVALFDEAFFAYREDADLAWRGNILGWRCIYVPSAVGYHRRVVTPERRQELPPELNRYGVRNRFLLQLNNFSWLLWECILPGVIWRNILVIAAVLFKEKSSRRGIYEVFLLARRAATRRKELFSRRRVKPREIAKFFRYSPYVEVIR